MPVYEYHPDELARISVVRQAHGLGLDEVKAQWQAACDREKHALAGPREPRKPTEVDIASCQKLEWARIVRVMTEQQMAVYSPDEDRRVARREEQRVRRTAIEAAWDEQSGGGLPVEVLRHRIYRITARATAASAGEEALIRHVFAASGGAAVEHARAMFVRPGSIYQDGEYRITAVEQILPEPGEFP
ncbi:hypothetical protein [Streptomyces roseus]|uniref:Uncharacterized protein n=1 Tax=Streptomyces roseus TaxID=66430 RepID=A0A0J7AES5_9ACTN|nr:hypothetical protein [Streptomyces roseus]KMO95691.1 hypothetical protein ACS04_22290 [Streptomyces roseus]